jgi:cyclase
MLKKRIIPCLDIKDGRTVKGVNFVNIIDAGDPIELAKIYADNGADELVFLDITATVEKRKTLSVLVEKISKQINIPFTVGGGINTVDDARVIINSGADKISINTSAVKRPELITEISQQFGSQCVVLAVDVDLIDNQWIVTTHGGRNKTLIDAINWMIEGEKLGAGEILLTSMKHDGTKNGFAIELYQEICAKVNIPLIASGGAGKMEHFSSLFQQTKVSAALAASIFHFNEIPVSELKKYLQNINIPIR